MFPDSTTAGFPLQLQASILKCFMYLFSPSIKPGNGSQFAAPSYGKICQNYIQASFLLFSLVLCASSHCPSGYQHWQFQSGEEMHGEISACQVLCLEEYVLDDGFFLLTLGSLCWNDFICSLMHSPPFPFFIGLRIYITSKFTVCGVLRVSWIHGLCSLCYCLSCLYPAPKVAFLWCLVMDH